MCVLTDEIYVSMNALREDARGRTKEDIADLVPAWIKALELISISVLLGVRATQRRKFEREDIIAVGESYRIGIWDGLLEYRLCTDENGPIGNF